MKNLSCANLQAPSLISQKSSPPLEKAKEEKTPTLIRSCMSQQNIREHIASPQELAKPTTLNSSGKVIGAKFFTSHSRTPSAQLSSNLPYIPNIKSKLDSESSDQESLAEPSNNRFMIRTNSKTKIKVAKVNKIKVISTIPGIENIAPKVNLLPNKVEKTFSEKKGFKFDLQKTNLLDLHLDELKLISDRSSRPSHESCRNRPTTHFLFPEGVECSRPKLSPLTPTAGALDCRFFTSNTPSKTPLGKIPTLQFGCNKFEPVNRLHEGRQIATAGAEENGLRPRNYNSDTVKYQMDESINLASMVSPQMRPISNIYSFRASPGVASEGITPKSFQPSEMKIKIRKRANPKFKNEEAVLNKLFNSVSQQP